MRPEHKLLEESLGSGAALPASRTPRTRRRNPGPARPGRGRCSRARPGPISAFRWPGPAVPGSRPRPRPRALRGAASAGSRGRARGPRAGAPGAALRPRAAALTAAAPPWSPGNALPGPARNGRSSRGHPEARPGLAPRSPTGPSPRSGSGGRKMMEDGLGRSCGPGPGAGTYRKKSFLQ